MVRDMKRGVSPDASQFIKFCAYRWGTGTGCHKLATRTTMRMMMKIVITATTTATTITKTANNTRETEFRIDNIGKGTQNIWTHHTQEH